MGLGELSPWHWLTVAVVFVILFGAKKMPDAARSLGRSLRIFKSEIGNLGSDEETPTAPPAPAPLTGARAPEGRSDSAAKVPSPADPGREA